MNNILYIIDNLILEDSYKESLITILNNPKSTQELEDNIKKLSKQDKEKVYQILQKITKQSDDNILYHGTTEKIAQNIRKSGFKITKGKRTGFLGAVHEVQNMGIFLSDKYQLAYAYGADRDRYSGTATVIKAKLKSSKILDMRKWNASIPKDIRKIALKELSEYENKNVKRPTQQDMFWLMDQPNVVNAIKSHGFDAVIFKELRQTVKELGVNPSINASTYIVFEPSNLKIIPDRFRTMDDLFNYISN